MRQFRNTHATQFYPLIHNVYHFYIFMFRSAKSTTNKVFLFSNDEFKRVAIDLELKHIFGKIIRLVWNTTTLES